MQCPASQLVVRRLVFGLVLCGFAASAQPTPVPAFDLERGRLNPSGAHGLLVESADLLEPLNWRVGLALQYEHDPLVLLLDGHRAGAVVGSRLATTVVGTLGVADGLEVSAQLPVVLLQRGADLSSLGVAPVRGGSAAGTLWFAARAALAQQGHGAPLDLALGVALGLPFGSPEALTTDGDLAVMPSVSAGRRLTRMVRLGGSVSANLRKVTSLGTPVTVSAELGSVISPAVVLEVDGGGPRAELSARLDVPLTRIGLGAEVDLGVRYRVVDLLELYALGGPGFGPLPGTPAFRVLAGVAMSSALAHPAAERPVDCVAEPARCPTMDQDADGVPNGSDACPLVPGVERGQAGTAVGCPDLDSDQDGVLDSADRCPATAGSLEFRGCAVPDADGDGLADAEDLCPRSAGTRRYQGCPDTDGDGLPDRADQCPTELGVIELGGCPDRDADGDGIVDRLDACQGESGSQENEGCPVRRTQLVGLSRERLILKEQVHFASNRAEILPQSQLLLQQLAQILTQHPHITSLSIEGHTDSRGDPTLNLALSRQRAEAVRRALSAVGVRIPLTATGFGSTQPIAPNDSEAGRQANRRVEFVFGTAQPLSF